MKTCLLVAYCGSKAMPRTPRSPTGLRPSVLRLLTTSAAVLPGRKRLTRPACSRTHRSPLGANSIAVASDSPSATTDSVKFGGKLASRARFSSGSSAKRRRRQTGFDERHRGEVINGIFRTAEEQEPRQAAIILDECIPGDFSVGTSVNLFDILLTLKWVRT